MQSSNNTLVSLNPVHIRRARVYLGDEEALDFTCMGNMGAHKEIDHRATPVNCRGGAVRDFGLDELSLVFVVLCIS